MELVWYCETCGHQEPAEPAAEKAMPDSGLLMAVRPDEPPAQEPVPDLVEQLSGLKNDWTSADAKTYGLPPAQPEAARRFWCADCRVGAMGEEEALAHHGATGHLVVGEGGGT